MALFRLLHFPSTTPQNLSLPLPFLKPQHPNPTNSLHSFSLKRLIKPQRLSLYQLHTPFSAQAQPTTETSELQESETVEEEEEEFSKTRLLAQNVPWTCTADELRPLFEKYGSVLEIEFSMYNKTRNRGLAFVTMGSHEEALAALSNLESYEYEGRTLRLNWAKPKKEPVTPPKPKPMPVHNLFVANLPFQARAKDLKEFFSGNDANVVSAEIIFQDNPRRSTGYGFVSFYTKEEAEAVLSAFQGKEFMGRPIRVARSKRFLRQATKANIQSDNGTTELNSVEQLNAVEQSEKPNES